MPVELKVPAVGESITEVQIGQWLRGEGDQAAKDEALVEIESDKATVELPAPVTGRVVKVLKNAGETAAVGEVIGYMEGNGAAVAEATTSKEPPREETRTPQTSEKETQKNEDEETPLPAPKVELM